MQFCQIFLFFFYCHLSQLSHFISPLLTASDFPEAVGYANLRAEQRSRRERGDRVQLGLGLSSYVEITAMGGPDGISELALSQVAPKTFPLYPLSDRLCASHAYSVRRVALLRNIG